MHLRALPTTLEGRAVTAWWPPGGLPGLWVDFGEHDWPSGRWHRKPSARYACRCGFTAGATGPKKVEVFTATVPAEHRAACPLRPRAGERADTPGAGPARSPSTTETPGRDAA